MDDKLKVIAGYIVICLIWGSTWLVIKIGLDSFTPILSAGYRFLTAGIILYLVLSFKKIKLQMDRRSILLYINLGLFSFAFPYALVYWSEEYIPSSLASILFASFPLFTILFSKLMSNSEKITLQKLIGVVIGFSGVIVIFSENLNLDFNKYLLGMFAVIGSSFMQAFSAVTIKKYGEHLNPLSMNLIPMFITGISLTVLGYLFEDSSNSVIDMKGIISVLYLAIFGTIISFSTYYWLLKRISVVFLSLSSFITPVIAVILGWIIMNEYLSGRVLMGSSLVLIGILFANLNNIKNNYRDKIRKSIPAGKDN